MSLSRTQKIRISSFIAIHNYCIGHLPHPAVTKVLHKPNCGMWSCRPTRLPLKGKPCAGDIGLYTYLSQIMKQRGISDEFHCAGCA